MTDPRIKVQRDKSNVYVVILDEDAVQHTVQMDGKMARDMGEALYQAGCAVAEVVAP